MVGWPFVIVTHVAEGCLDYRHVSIFMIPFLYSCIMHFIHYVPCKIACRDRLIFLEMHVMSRSIEPFSSLNFSKNLECTSDKLYTLLWTSPETLHYHIIPKEGHSSFYHTRINDEQETFCDVELRATGSGFLRLIIRVHRCSWADQESGSMRPSPSIACLGCRPGKE